MKEKGRKRGAKEKRKKRKRSFPTFF